MTPTSERVRSLMQRARSSVFAGLMNYFLAVPPAPASRPRVTRFGGVYYGATYDKFYTAAKAELAKAKNAILTEPVVVLMEFVLERPRTGKLELPKGDCDNYAKGPLDAMTKACTFWNDDAQVAVLTVAKRYAEPNEEPGVLIEWGRLADV